MAVRWCAVASASTTDVRRTEPVTDILVCIVYAVIMAGITVTGINYAQTEERYWARRKKGEDDGQA